MVVVNAPMGRGPGSIAVCFALILVAASCTGPAKPSHEGPTSAATETATVTPSEATPTPSPVGALSGLRWHPTPIAPGTLLHDDGQRLWAVPLHGSPSLLWSHPK